MGKIRLSVALLLIGCSFTSLSAYGAVVTYSWSGIIELEPLLNDPWGVGGGKPFVVSTSIDQAAADVDPAVNFAKFLNGFSVSFLLDGTPGTVVNSGPHFVLFWDDVGGTQDIIDVCTYDVTFNGTSEELYFRVLLPSTTFSFTGTAESPPLFGEATHMFGSGNRVLVSPYWTRMSAGATVTSSAIPEPSTLAIWSLLATLGITIGWWRQKRRAA